MNKIIISKLWITTKWSIGNSRISKIIHCSNREEESQRSEKGIASEGWASPKLESTSSKLIKIASRLIFFKIKSILANVFLHFELENSKKSSRAYTDTKRLNQKDCITRQKRHLFLAHLKIKNQQVQAFPLRHIKSIVANSKRDRNLKEIRLLLITLENLLRQLKQGRTNFYSSSHQPMISN